METGGFLQNGVVSFPCSAMAVATERVATVPDAPARSCRAPPVDKTAAATLLSFSPAHFSRSPGNPNPNATAEP